MTPTSKTSPKSSRIRASLARTAPPTVGQMLEAIQQEEGALAKRIKNLESIRGFCKLVEEMTAVKVTSIQKLAMSDGYIITLTCGYPITWLLGADKVTFKAKGQERAVAPSNLVAELRRRYPKEEK